MTIRQSLTLRQIQLCNHHKNTITYPLTWEKNEIWTYARVIILRLGKSLIIVYHTRACQSNETTPDTNERLFGFGWGSKISIPMNDENLLTLSCSSVKNFFMFIKTNFEDKNIHFLIHRMALSMASTCFNHETYSVRLTNNSNFF